MKPQIKIIALLMSIFMLTSCSAIQPADSPIIPPESSVEPTPAPSPTKAENTSHKAEPVSLSSDEPDKFLSHEEAAAMLEKKTDKLTPLDIPIYPTDELLYGKDSLFYLGLDPCRFDSMHAVRMDFNSVIFSAFPTDAFRTLDNGFLYCQYLTDDGDKVFLFFKDSDEEYDKYYYRGFPILMSHALSYSDFKPIKLGDDIEEVRKVDDVIDYYLPGFEDLDEDYFKNLKEMGIELYLTSVHLLKDGILKYEYQRNIEDDKSQYTISDIEYHEDFMLKSASGTINYQIAEMDYVE